MTMAVLAWLVAIPLLGFVTGLRTMTPIAVLCLFAYRGHLPVDDTWAAWSGRLVSLIIFALLAVGELIGDKLPTTPNRTSFFPLMARLAFGGLVGAIVATGLEGSVFEGILLGVSGALLGTFGGYLVRHELTHRFGLKDWHVAVAEDAFAITCAFLAMGVVTG